MNANERLSDELGDESVFWQEYQRKEDRQYDGFLHSIVQFFESLVAPQSKDSLMYCVSSAKSYSIKVLTINVIFLIVFIVLIGTTDVEVIGDVNSPKYMVIIQQMNIWLFFSLFGLGYFLLLQFLPNSFKDHFDMCPHEVWVNYWRTINVSFLLIIVVKLFRYGPMYHDLCYEQIDLNIRSDNSYTFVFLEFFVDTIQTVVFTTLPTHWTYSVFLCGVKLASHSALINSCIGAMNRSNMKWFVEIAILSMVNIYLILAASSSTLMRSSESIHQLQTDLRESYERHKHKLVHFLSCGVKYPLQCALLSVDNVLDCLDLDPGGGAAAGPTTPSAVSSSEGSPSGSGRSPSGGERQGVGRLLISGKEALTSVAIRASSLCDDLLLLLRLQEAQGSGAERELTVLNVRDLFQSVLDATPHSEALHYVRLVTPYCSIRGDKELLSVLMRHFLLFATGHINSRLVALTSSSATSSAALRALEGVAQLRITLEENSLFSAKDPLKHCRYLLRMTVNVDRDGSRRNGGASAVGGGGGGVAGSDVQFGLYVKKSVVMCHEIVKHLKDSSLSVSEAELNHFELSVECEQFSPDSVSLPSHEEGEREVKYEVGLVLLDSVVEGVVRNTLQDCADVAAPKSFLSLNELLNSPLRLNSFQVLFLDSVVDCKLLKEVGYCGLTVLVSCNRAYLTSTTADMTAGPAVVRSHCDYIFPLPCFLLDSKELVQWLESSGAARILRQRETLARERDEYSSSRGEVVGGGGGPVTYFPHDTFAAYAAPPPLAPAAVQWSVSRSLSSCCSSVGWFLLHTEFGVSRIPSSQYENYSKWRLLNPTRSFFHHTNLVTARLLLYMAHNVVHIYLRGGSLYFGGFNSVLIVTVLVIFRRYVYQWMIRHCKKVFSGFNLYYFWSIVSLLYVTVNLLGLLVVLVQGRCSAKDCAPIFEMSGRNDLVSQRIGDVFNGKSLIDFVTNGGGIFIGWLFHFTWPFRLMYIAISALRVFFILGLIVRSLVSDLLLSLVLLLFVLLIVVAVGVEVHSENLYREEYSLLRKHLLRQHLCDWCEAVARQELRHDLREASEARTAFVNLLTKKVISGEILLNEDLLRFLHPVHFAGIKLAEVTHLLQYSPSTRDTAASSDTSSNAAAAAVNAASGAVVLKNVFVLRDFLTLFLLRFKDTADSLGIKLFLDLDPTLTVVRVNQALFISLLSGAVSAAITNILRSLREHELRYVKGVKLSEKGQLYRTSSCDTQQEILIIVKPLRPAMDDKSAQPVPRFMDTRMMIVNVLDTSSNVNYNNSNDSKRDKGGGPYWGDCRASEGEGAEEQRQLGALEDWQSLYSCELSSGDMCTSLIEDCGRRSGGNGRDYFVERAPLSHAHYGAYQRFTMPYKISKESKKAAECRTAADSQEGRRVLDSCVVQGVDREVRPLLEVYQQQQLASASNRQSSSTTMSEKSEWRRRNPSSARRSILLYVNRNAESVKEYGRYGTLFEMNGWKCSSCNDAMHKESGSVELGTESLDAILIDSKVGDFLFNVILAARVKYGPSLVVAVLSDSEADIGRNSVFLTEITTVDVNLIKPISPEVLIDACNRNVISQLMLLK